MSTFEGQWSVDVSRVSTSTLSEVSTFLAPRLSPTKKPIKSEERSDWLSSQNLCYISSHICNYRPTTFLQKWEELISQIPTQGWFQRCAITDIFFMCDTNQLFEPFWGVLTELPHSPQWLRLSTLCNIYIYINYNRDQWKYRCVTSHMLVGYVSYIMNMDVSVEWKGVCPINPQQVVHSSWNLVTRI